MSDKPRPKSRRTVAEWEALLAERQERCGLLERALWDRLMTAEERRRIWERMGEPVTVTMSRQEVRAFSGRKDDDTQLRATVYRPEGPNPYVVVEEVWPGGSHVTVETWDSWDRSVRDRERFWSDAIRALAERARGALEASRRGIQAVVQAPRAE
jgi:hypothetical protein